MHAWCLASGRSLVASGRVLYPRTDSGAEVRRVFHRLRHAPIENFDEHFKSVLECHAAVPTKGLSDTASFALGAVFVCQLVPLDRNQGILAPTVGSKPASGPLEQL
jgi:hypothetical protein